VLELESYLIRKILSCSSDPHYTRRYEERTSAMSRTNRITR